MLTKLQKLEQVYFIEEDLLSGKSSSSYYRFKNIKMQKKITVKHKMLVK